MVPLAIILFVCIFQSIYTADGAPKISDLSFTPVTSKWQKEACRRIGAKVKNSIEDSFGSKGKKLEKPTIRQAVWGDGDSFFRAISYHITGTQHDHMKVRQAVVKYMRNHMQDEYSEDYLNKMAECGKWVTSAEVAATARLLKTPIFVYADYDRTGTFTWAQYSPRQDYELEYDDDIPRIYLWSRNADRFDIVKEVKVKSDNRGASSSRQSTSSGPSEPGPSHTAASSPRRASSGDFNEEVQRLSDRFPDVMRLTSSSGERGSGKKTWTYTPVHYEWQWKVASTLGVEVVYSMTDYWDSKGSKLTRPKKTAGMDDDGNSFFRAVSYCVTGEEHAHKKIRKVVADYIGASNESMKHHKMSKDDVKNLRKFGKEPQGRVITATARLLQTPIFLYMPSQSSAGWEWIQYSSREENALETNDTLPRIYLKLNNQRYEVVLEVEQ